MKNALTRLISKSLNFALTLRGPAWSVSRQRFTTRRSQGCGGEVSQSAFTLVELLTAMAVLVMIAAMIFSIISQTSQAVRTANDRVESFQSARLAFDTLSRQVGQATLNTYYDYYDKNRKTRTSSNSSSFTPDIYGRQSDLHFVSGNNLVPSEWNPVAQSIFFEAPIDYSIKTNYHGKNLLNACGFFIGYTSDASEKPAELEQAQGARIANEYRFRLFSMSQPTENLQIYAQTDPAKQKDWFQKPLLASATDTAAARQNGIYPIADNILALVVWPKLPSSQGGDPAQLAPNYNYDSKNPWVTGAQPGWASSAAQPAQMHQPPPLLDVTMVTIDESSARRLLKGKTSTDQALAALGVSLSDKFQDPNRLDAELADIQAKLAAKNVKCRIFRTMIPVRSGKWSSTSQTNL